MPPHITQLQDIQKLGLGLHFNILAKNINNSVPTAR